MAKAMKHGFSGPERKKRNGEKKRKNLPTSLKTSKCLLKIVDNEENAGDEHTDTRANIHMRIGKRRNAALLLTSRTMKTFTQKSIFFASSLYLAFPCMLFTRLTRNYPFHFSSWYGTPAYFLREKYTTVKWEKKRKKKVFAYFITSNANLDAVEVSGSLARYLKNGLKALFNCTWTTWSR